MNDSTDLFHKLRPRLQGIAYRMLGSTAEAEEVVQDTWLRWHEAEQARLDSGEAWLVAVTTRLAIDRLRAARTRREHYVGTWLPEPLMSDAPITPEQLLERADDVSVAFMLMLERLAPEARAAFLLREVFDADYDEVAAALGKTEPACRQLVHRAKAQLQDTRPRYSVPRETHRRLLQAFANAAARGEFSSIRSMLADDAELIGDGGGKVPSIGVPVLGSQRIANSTWQPASDFATPSASTWWFSTVSGGCCVSSMAHSNRPRRSKPMANASCAFTCNATPTSWPASPRHWGRELSVTKQVPRTS